MLHGRLPDLRRTIEDGIPVQHKAVLVAHAEREPHVAELQQHGLCACNLAHTALPADACESNLAPSGVVLGAPGRSGP